jgi:hypothetical protein
VGPLGPTPGGSGQPRPQFGFLPWLAFFLALSLRLLVRFDTVRQCYSVRNQGGQRGWAAPARVRLSTGELVAAGR